MPPEELAEAVGVSRWYKRHGFSRRRALQAQAFYYCATGICPLVSMRFFEAITGPKKDRWLVQMVGLLAVSIGVSLFVSSRSEKLDPGAKALSVTAAVSFAAIDIIHASRRRISPVYLADAVIELSIVALLARAE